MRPIRDGCPQNFPPAQLPSPPPTRPRAATYKPPLACETIHGRVFLLRVVLLVSFKTTKHKVLPLSINVNREFINPGLLQQGFWIRGTCLTSSSAQIPGQTILTPTSARRFWGSTVFGGFKGNTKGQLPCLGTLKKGQTQTRTERTKNPWNPPRPESCFEPLQNPARILLPTVDTRNPFRNT